jgi:DNA invertase Pin-like site-specific DNA recombinase
VTVTLGYATADPGCGAVDDQLAELAAAGVDPRRVFTDRAPGPADKRRPGLQALLSYARPGDVVVVVAIARLGRSVAEVVQTVADLTSRGIMLRCVHNGLDTGTSTGQVVAGVLTELAALETDRISP